MIPEFYDKEQRKKFLNDPNRMPEGCSNYYNNMVKGESLQQTLSKFPIDHTDHQQKGFFE